MQKKKVGILRGGKGKHYEKSLNKGGEIILHILEKLGDRYQVLDIFIDKNDIWHFAGKEIKPAELMHRVDIVWNVSSPSYSNVLQSFSIPTIGADVFHNSVIQNRALLEEHMKKVGISLPRYFVIPVYQKDFDGDKDKFVIKKAKEVHAKFAGPWFVKSFAHDANMGTHIAKIFPELINAISDCVEHNESILIEEFISGKNISTHAVAGFRNKENYIFPNTENLSKLEKENLQKAAEQLHKHFNNPKYLHSEFVLDLRKGSNKIYLRNIEFNPDLSDNSHLSGACNAVGVNTHDIVAHILETF
jgi:D-alanine-D-alanine ligase-like ATP-grasp enzyme